MLYSLFGKNGDKMVYCKSIVIKRRQGMTDEQVENAPGLIVDLFPKVVFKLMLESRSLIGWYTRIDKINLKNYLSKWKVMVFAWWWNILHPRPANNFQFVPTVTWRYQYHQLSTHLSLPALFLLLRFIISYYMAHIYMSHILWNDHLPTLSKG